MSYACGTSYFTKMVDDICGYTVSLIKNLFVNTSEQLIISFHIFLSNGKSLLYLGRSVSRSVGLQNEIYLDETHCSKHLNDYSEFNFINSATLPPHK